MERDQVLKSSYIWVKDFCIERTWSADVAFFSGR
tara:strand:- start:714 stop:815 length:102 start_codon:yes stop_codon:yes gene_type:complete